MNGCTSIEKCTTVGDGGGKQQISATETPPVLRERTYVTARLDADTALPISVRSQAPTARGSPRGQSSETLGQETSEVTEEVRFPGAYRTSASSVTYPKHFLQPVQENAPGPPIRIAASASSSPPADAVAADALRMIEATGSTQVNYPDSIDTLSAAVGAADADASASMVPAVTPTLLIDLIGLETPADPLLAPTAASMSASTTASTSMVTPAVASDERPEAEAAVDPTEAEPVAEVMPTTSPSVTLAPVPAVAALSAAVATPVALPAAAAAEQDAVAAVAMARSQEPAMASPAIVRAMASSADPAAKAQEWPTPVPPATVQLAPAEALVTTHIGTPSKTSTEAPAKAPAAALADMLASALPDLLTLSPSTVSEARHALDDIKAAPSLEPKPPVLEPSASEPPLGAPTEASTAAPTVPTAPTAAAACIVPGPMAPPTQSPAANAQKTCDDLLTGMRTCSEASTGFANVGLRTEGLLVSG